MSNVIDLAERRGAEAGAPGAQCAACGGEWFELRADHPQMPPHGAVALGPDGSVRGYAGVPHCTTCATPWRP